MKHLVRLSKVSDETSPLSRSTLYKYHTTGKYPRLFVKIGGALFLDQRELEKVVEAGRGQSGAEGKGARKDG